MNKSEELAKVLGIGPVIQQITKQYVANWGVHHFRDPKVKSKKYLLKISELQRLKIDYTEDGLINDNYHQISYKISKYPDFTKPSNFVKLIELQVSKKLIVGRYLQGSGTYGVPFSNQWYDRESFLIILTDYLSRTDKCFARNRNKIMYKAQQTEWDY